MERKVRDALLISYIRQYLKEPAGMKRDKWNYEDGCILMGVIKLYEALGETGFLDFVLDYLDSYVSEEGALLHYQEQAYNLDSVAPGRALLFAWEQTGKEKYMLAAQALKKQLDGQPRIQAGNFWHKKIYPNQVWLDGLFMAQPFYMAWDTKFGKKEHYYDIVSQFEKVRAYMYHKKKGLYYHGYDESRRAFWANPVTGLSKSIWLRAEGWYLLALTNTMGEMASGMYEYYRSLADIFKEAIKGLLAFQDKESGLFFQLPDQPDFPGNYTEASGSAMVGAAVFEGCRNRVLLTEKYRETGERILDGLVEEKLKEQDGKLTLCDICLTAGLGPAEGRRDGSASYYVSEKIVSDDRKGIGALMMAYAQYLLLCRKEGREKGGENNGISHITCNSQKRGD